MNSDSRPAPALDANASKRSAGAVDCERLDAVCDFIRVDAAVRRRREEAVTLDRYLDTVPGLVEDPVLADTAIRVVLDSAVAKGRNRAAAAADLRRAHPELSDAIELARILDNAFDTTGAFLRFAGERYSPTLPTDFGPPWRGGERRFWLTDRVAAGAHGTVFRAYDRALSTDGRTAWAAIKVLGVADAGAEMARREAIRARVIDHPAVARVLTAGETDDNHSFIAFEFVEGKSLRAWRSDDPALTGEAAGVKLISEIAQGMAAAQAVGVSHGDLHPGNILITPSGLPKIVDFGLGHLSTGTIIGGKSKGALGFMPPECWLEREVNPVQVDVFGMGALLHWLVLGSPPNGDSCEAAEQELAQGGRTPQQLARSLKARGIDCDLAWILGRSLSGDPATRYHSAAAFLVDLTRWSHHEPLRWTKPTVRRRAHLVIRRAPVTVALCVLAAALGIGGAAASTAIALRGRVEVAEQASRASEAQLRSMRAESERTNQAKRVAAGLMNLVNQPLAGEPEPGWLLTLSLLDDLIRIEGGTLALADRRLERQIEAAEYFCGEIAGQEGECSMAAVMWHAALGRWLLEAGRWNEASVVLKRVLDDARNFHPGDPMIERLSVMADAATVLGAGRARSDASAVTDAEDRLRRIGTGELPPAVRLLIDGRESE